VDEGLDTSATYPTRVVSLERSVGDRGGDSALLVLLARSLKDPILFAKKEADYSQCLMWLHFQTSMISYFVSPSLLPHINISNSIAPLCYIFLLQVDDAILVMYYHNLITIVVNVLS
jgi:hypothetical protein